MSFEALYRQLFPDLHRYAFSILKDSDWATDVVQEAFIKYYHQLQNKSEITHNKAYLYRIVNNTAISQLRQQATQQKHYTLVAEANEVEQNAEEQRIQIEQNQTITALVSKIMNELPEQCKNVFIKSRSEGKKYREIADEMNISIKTVEAHMSKALKIIQEFIRVNRDLLSLIQIVMLYELCC